MWRDLNENGIADAGEITTLSAQNITTIRSEDYGLHVSHQNFNIWRRVA